MLCARFGWNLPGGSGEEDEYVKSLEKRRWEGRRQDDDRQRSNFNQKRLPGPKA